MGRDGNECCQGHQCWRGRTTWGITSTGTRKPPEAQLIEGKPARTRATWASRRPAACATNSTREFPSPKFYHFATDIAGKRLISDAAARAGSTWPSSASRARIPLKDFKYLLNARSSGRKEAHIHPFLSPDGSMAFFNSDESGILQAYMIRGL